MNAIKFIQQHGVDKAREVLATCHGIPSYTFKVKVGHGYSACQSVDLSDLKRLVESIDLIMKVGGINSAKMILSDMDYDSVDWDEDQFSYCRLLEQAIADYESIGGEYV